MTQPLEGENKDEAVNDHGGVLIEKGAGRE
jgi:hypothetical protein